MGTEGLRVVVKIGTSSLIGANESGDSKLSLVQLAKTVEVLCKLREQGHYVVLVSSGAVGAGCEKMGLNERPNQLSARRALAAIGQIHLMAKYEHLFSSLGHHFGQVLLTYENFVDRTQFLNAKNTFDELFKLGAIPIVNENDSVGIQELKEDNDKLAGMVGNLIEADLVFLMTDVDGVYTANPFKDPNAKRIQYVSDVDELKRRCDLGTGEDSEWGTGGMAAKISAAALTTSLGVRSVIMKAVDCSKIEEYVDQYIQSEESGDDEASEPPVFSFGTTFEKNLDPPKERKRWIQSLHRRGTIVVDDGAAEAVQENKTLFAVGIISCDGEFSANEAISITNRQKEEVACGLCNFSSEDLNKVIGLTSEQVSDLLDQSGAVVERGNMAVPQ